MLRDTGTLPNARWDESIVTLIEVAVETMLDRYLEILQKTEHAD